MLFNLSDHNSLANNFVAELRDVNVQQDRMRFRRNLERLGEVLGYELSKTLQYRDIEVETPLGIANVALSTDRVVLATILRAGLPLHHGLLNYFDHADNAFVSAYRRHHKDGSFEIKLEYASCPDLNDSVLVLADPMLATGSSMVIAAKELMSFGKPKKIHIVTAVASVSGVNYVKRHLPNVSLWIGAIDEELTAKSFIVPGLGDAGDLCYGSKLRD